MITGSLVIEEHKNIIVQNIKINASDGEENALDGIEISGSERVWVDHVEIFDAADGNLDVVRQSNYVPVSWSKFSGRHRRSRSCPATGHGIVRS